MGLLDKLKDVVGIEEIEDDELTEEEVRRAERQMERQTMVPRTHSSRQMRENVVPLNRMTAAMKLVVIEPTSFDESSKLVDSLKERKPIIVNLEKMDTTTAKKIFDFLSGATYALNGNVQKIANNIFLFAPENVDISLGETSSSNYEFTGIEGFQKDTWR